MKKLIFAALAILSISAYSQPEVKIIPKDYSFKLVYGEAGDYKQFVGSCTTDAIDLSKYRGAVTLWVDSDTSIVAANGHNHASGADSCMSISLQLYNIMTGDWGEAIFGSNTALLDTFARSAVNVDGTANDMYMPMPNFNDAQWAWADSARWIASIGVGDTLRSKMYIGGQ